MGMRDDRTTGTDDRSGGRILVAAQTVFPEQRHNHFPEGSPGEHTPVEGARLAQRRKTGGPVGTGRTRPAPRTAAQRTRTVLAPRRGDHADERQ